MKLIQKTLLYYFLISLPLLVIASLFSYYLIRTELRDGTDEALQKEVKNAEHLINSFKEPYAVFLSSDSLSTITVVKNSKPKPRFIFSDTSIYDINMQEYLSYRTLKSNYTFNNNSYLISVSKTTLEEEELIEGLLFAFGLILLFIVVGFFIVNWLLSKTLWKPFYKTLSELNVYEIKNHEQHYFEEVNTKEFNQLHEVLNKMTKKIYTDYLHQKEFTENASHEMQTPLAIIDANLSLLMQSPNLKEEEMNRLQVIENTTKKLASLNKALILLSKIENNQFKENETVNLNEVITKAIKNYEDSIESKKINLELNISNDSTIKMNAPLAYSMFANLLQNAIRHNKVGGHIVINLSPSLLVISNSGEPLNINPDELFVRFKKNNASKDSLGLGLSIVKSIVTLYNFKVEYNYANNFHTFSLHF